MVAFLHRHSGLGTRYGPPVVCNAAPYVIFGSRTNPDIATCLVVVVIGRPY